jgi:DNA-binding transcriptional ArsR family regulator
MPADRPAVPDNAGLIDDPERALLALSPIRRRLLAALREPGSAAGLAKKLNLPRQQLGYHLRALEAAGLVHLVAEQKRRGFVERVLVAASDAFVFDPALMGGASQVEAQDRHAAQHLVAAAGTVVREVTRMRGAAEAAGQRLLTLTIEADVGFEQPQDFEDFSRALGEAIAAVAARYQPGPGKRGYHLMLGAHPAVADTKSKAVN